MQQTNEHCDPGRISVGRLKWAAQSSAEVICDAD